MMHCISKEPTLTVEAAQCPQYHTPPRVCVSGKRVPTTTLQSSRSVRGIVVEVQLAHVVPGHLGPAILRDVIHAHGATRVGVAEGGVVDGLPP